MISVVVHNIILNFQGASLDVTAAVTNLVAMIANVIMAGCALYTLCYTVKTNNKTAQEGRKAAELNNKMAELNYRQLIVDANRNFLALSQSNSKSDDKDKHDRAVDSAIEQLLNAYEVICYLMRDEIPSEDFRALYGNEMLEIIDTEPFKQKIDKKKGNYCYIKRARSLLEK